ncbi:MAG TPA: hypothetical protein PKH39_07155 [Woeseiaceae bacterium]|nr:hypothetical protein [Woeseiaceae bacterium]
MVIGRCAYTGDPIEDVSDGIWDDGEWISWEYINQLQELQHPQPSAKAVDPELREIFEALVHTAAAYKQHTGRFLDIFGELGELYAEIELGIKRHKLNAPGSDGRVGDDFIEVKTISPLKQDDKVRVKRQGNFNKLYVVKITENFFFEGRMIDRRELKKGDGKFASVRFGDLESDEQ